MTLESEMAASVGDAARQRYQLLSLIGNGLCRRFGYDVEDGLEACQRYVVDRYGWLPAMARGLSQDDLYFLLKELADDVVVGKLPAPPFGSGITVDPPQVKRPRKKRLTGQDVADLREQNRR